MAAGSVEKSLFPNKSMRNRSEERVDEAAETTVPGVQDWKTKIERLED